MEFETKDKATLLDYLKQPLFISHVAWFSIVQLRFLYFIGNLNPLLNHRLDHDVAQGNTQTKYIQKSITIFLNCFKRSNVTDINGLHNVTNHLVLKLLEYDHLIYVRICCSYNWCIGCFIHLVVYTIHIHVDIFVFLSVSKFTDWCFYILMAGIITSILAGLSYDRLKPFFKSRHVLFDYCFLRLSLSVKVKTRTYIYTL